MKKFLILTFAALALTGCNSAAQQTNSTANVNSPNTNTAIVKPGNSTVVSSHSTDLEKTDITTPSSNKSGSTGSPMAKPVDVTGMTADIEKAEKAYQKNPKNEKAKAELAKAYFVRATALTGAAQYRSALGDYRKGLKLNPNDNEARNMHDEIIRIFSTMSDRTIPKEGEEPAPMPIN